jgi:hypothetical protein
MLPAEGSTVPTVAALYVQRGGVYWEMPGVDPWDESRDARLYPGPWPVVAHPPCARWGRYWFGSPSSPKRFEKGSDGGCFAAALSAVRRWGGVLEHPEASHAWAAFGLLPPPRSGAWVNADLQGGWTCRVDQARYGHRGNKATWLYAHGVRLPSLDWAPGCVRPEPSEFERARGKRSGMVERMGKPERAATPPAFRDLLLSIARTARVAPSALPSRAAQETP